MRDHKQSRSSMFLFEWSVFFIGLFIMAFGIALMIKAELGSAPWDVLHIGLFTQFGLTIGTWSIIMGFFVILATALLTKKFPQSGAFLNMVFVGLFIDFYLWLPIFPDPMTFVGKWLYLLIGILILGFGIGLYISSNCGAGPRDSLMLALTEKFGIKVSRIRLYMELFVLFFGWVLKGPISFGTILFCLTIGGIVGKTLPLCQKLVKFSLERRVQYENINKRPIRVNHHDSISKEIR
ncbi:YitT family protein [Fictibacillus nanhaiensis]|uniref:YczE/YyaS/YitT family protein n=1 Tax=Fictibacillus nanhaiensis TaxID=742169 RepID=UPI001C971880|nr:YitT family protein [Fictibacillus nanhaiensis]MBY6035358.1 YitT family protein [Fictibacillus nanhaiensis]